MFEKLIGKEWGEAISPHLSKEEFKRLGIILKKEYDSFTVYPNKEDIFNAFLFTPYHKTKVVWIGLDPYIRENEAYGVSFGIQDSCKIIPPSLKNIYKEVETDVYNGLNLDFDYSLRSWADQGCLMLNTALTVRAGKTGSHLKIWSSFTKSVIKALNEKDFCIYILLGRKAQEYKKYIIDSPSIHIIQTAHPAAESYYGGKAGFFGSKIFSKTNQILINNGKEEIKW